jgi:hypothetical protein
MPVLGALTRVNCVATSANSYTRPTVDAAQVQPVLSNADKELAGHLFGRALVGQGVHLHPRQGELELLKRCNTTMAEVRCRYIKHGRGNVAPDMAKTDLKSFWLTTAMQLVATALEETEEDDRRLVLLKAGLACEVGVGQCKEHSFLTAVLHSQKLKPGESVEILHNANVDHNIAIHMGALGPDGSRIEILLDSWGEGPAINLKNFDAEDNTYQADARTGFSRVALITHQSATADFFVFQEGQEFGRAVKDCIGAAYQKLMVANTQLARHRIWQPFFPIDPKFASDVKTKLDQVASPEGPLHQTGLQGWLTLCLKPLLSKQAKEKAARLPFYALHTKIYQSALAAGIARKAFSVSVKDATASAPAILEHAAHMLSSMSERSVQTPNL